MYLHAYAVPPLYRAQRAANLSSARKAYRVSIPPPNTRSLRLVFEQKARRLASWNICLIDAWKPQGGRAVRQVVFAAKFYSRSHDAVIRVHDEAGNVIETHEPTARQSRAN